MTIELAINGERRTIDCEPGESLLRVLRREGFFSVRFGSETGETGAAAVLVDGRLVSAEIMLAAQADGATVETIEGVSDSREIADLQRAFHERNALQCGFCTPGFLLTAQELLAQNPSPSRVEIRAFISGNYCRCTGYQAIVDAIERVAGERQAAE